MTPLADAAPSTRELKRDVNCGQVSIRRRYLYRASNPTIGDHLYTTDKAELTSLLSQGYSDEGVEAEIWSDLGDGTGPVRTPFFRLLHINSGVHLFTTDTNERDTLVGTGSYVYEKTVGYVQTDSTCGAIPLHRLWHSPEDHLLTINPIEKEHSINKEGYTYEFIQGYVWNPCGIDQVDFLRGRNQARSDHFYTTSKAEMDAAVKNNGYVQEETQAVIWSTRTGGLTPLYRLYSSDPRTDHFYTIDLDERLVENIAANAPL
ncbi:hypothetical protein VNI00_008365 [Paramarasmius palmivorus]|uniref:DUF5648 domain-containing protein n=1 Tax=Paramarasmius palmivorus TaxID=297713 RepID=A0AAW0CYM5_9AGAR